MSLMDLTENMIQLGYTSQAAKAALCQDIVLKAIAKSSLFENDTVKGGLMLIKKKFLPLYNAS